MLCTLCARWRERRERALFPVVQVVFVSAALGLALGALSLGLHVYIQSAKPDFTGEAARTIAQNVATQFRAAVMYDSGAAARIDAVGARTWTATTTVSGSSVNATVTATPSGNLVTVDVVIGTTAVRQFVSLSATAVPPGSTVGV